ncbi:GNAT family N-acetyltransferase [Streptomyces phaeochromogenes]|uniref:GNAT family N-acetyltransferase n=1 Tax=Streptomyces phaeochromogenes TaxID=1923 RepID=UPI00386C10EF|nr:GNAT family N-acetyltransferase [Streptomyces phaeochromogenes]
MERTAATVPAGGQAVRVLERAGGQVGRLDYQVCHPCQLGYIDSIAVAARWQGRGLGREAVHTALAPCPDYKWSTSRQSSQGRRFFSAMEEETDVAFPPSSVRCPHMLLARPLAGPIRGFFASSGSPRTRMGRS